jgi:DNA polymerase I-like protein with 3'-5' exonuclease and polymerase domains
MVKERKTNMNAYRKYVTIEQPNQLILSDLPFRAGQRVEIIILGEDSQETDPQLEELRQKIDSAAEQILAGNVTDGELVFEQLQTRLREEYGLK